MQAVDLGFNPNFQVKNRYKISRAVATLNVIGVEPVSELGRLGDEKIWLLSHHGFWVISTNAFDRFF